MLRWKCNRRRKNAEGEHAARFDPPSAYLCAEADWAPGAAQMLVDEKPRRLRRTRVRSEKKKE